MTVAVTPRSEPGKVVGKVWRSRENPGKIPEKLVTAEIPWQIDGSDMLKGKKIENGKSNPKSFDEGTWSMNLAKESQASDKAIKIGKQKVLPIKTWGQVWFL